MKHIYFITEYGDSPEKSVKIGISQNPEVRLVQLQTGNEKPYTIARAALIRDAKAVEAALHMLLSEYKTKGEWFKLPTEVLHKVIDLINSMDLDCDCNACKGLTHLRIAKRYEPHVFAV